MCQTIDLLGVNEEEISPTVPRSKVVSSVLLAALKYGMGGIIAIFISDHLSYSWRLPFVLFNFLTMRVCRHHLPELDQIKEYLGG